MKDRNSYEERHHFSVINLIYNYDRFDDGSVGEIIKLEDMAFNTASEPVDFEPPFDPSYSSKISLISI